MNSNEPQFYLLIMDPCALNQLWRCGSWRKISKRIDVSVEAVSLLHSHKVDPASLQGVGATIVRRRLRELIDCGRRQIVILPLFLGPSLAIIEYLPNWSLRLASAARIWWCALDCR